MDRKWATALVAAFMVSACGGGQTEVTEAEEALGNEFQPAAPSPGAAGPVPEGGNQNGPMAGDSTAGETDPGNSQ